MGFGGSLRAFLSTFGRGEDDSEGGGVSDGERVESCRFTVAVGRRKEGAA